MKKKVLLVVYNNLAKGGVQSVIMSIARGLSEFYMFDVMCFEDEPAYYDEEFQKYGGQIFRFGAFDRCNTWHRKFDNYVRGPYICENLRKVLKEHGPYEAIHCHNGIESGLCVAVAKKIGIPVRIVHAHTAFPATKGNLIFRCYRSYLNHLIDKNATSLIGCSELANQVTFRRKKAKVVYNTIDFSKFVPLPVCGNKMETAPKLVQVGLFCENKNQLFTLNVLKEVCKTFSNAQLILVGRAPSKELQDYLLNLKKFVSENSMENNVTFVPADSDIPQVYSISDCVLMPSHYEGLPLVPIEAQAMKVQCFLSNTISKEVDCGGCCFLPLDQGARYWAEEIIDWFRSSKQLRAETNMDKFKTENIMSAYKRLYEGKEEVM